MRRTPSRSRALAAALVTGLVGGLLAVVTATSSPAPAGALGVVSVHLTPGETEGTSQKRAATYFGIDCTSEQLCETAGVSITIKKSTKKPVPKYYNAERARIVNGTTTPLAFLENDGSNTDVDCSTGNCFYVGYNRKRSPSSGAIAVGPARVFRSVSATGSGAIDKRTSIPGMTYATGVTCDGAAPTCLVVGHSTGTPTVGKLSVYDAASGTASAPVNLPMERGQDVDCATDGPCWVVGRASSGGAVVPVGRDGTVGTAIAIPGVTTIAAIDCPSSTCFATGGTTGGTLSKVVELRPDGTVGTVSTIQAMLTQGIGCVRGTTDCYVVGGNGETVTGRNRGIVVPVANGIPGTKQEVASPALSDIDCPSTARCFAVGESRIVTDPVLTDHVDGITGGEIMQGAVVTLSITPLPTTTTSTSTSTSTSTTIPTTTTTVEEPTTTTTVDEPTTTTTVDEPTTTTTVEEPTTTTTVDEPTTTTTVEEPTTTTTVDEPTTTTTVAPTPTNTLCRAIAIYLPAFSFLFRLFGLCP